MGMYDYTRNLIKYDMIISDFRVKKMVSLNIIDVTLFSNILILSKCQSGQYMIAI